MVDWNLLISIGGVLGGAIVGALLAPYLNYKLSERKFAKEIFMKKRLEYFSKIYGNLAEEKERYFNIIPFTAYKELKKPLAELFNKNEEVIRMFDRPLFPLPFKETLFLNYDDFEIIIKDWNQERSKRKEAIKKSIINKSSSGGIHRNIREYLKFLSSIQSLLDKKVFKVKRKDPFLEFYGFPKGKPILLNYDNPKSKHFLGRIN